MTQTQTQPAQARAFTRRPVVVQAIQLRGSRDEDIAAVKAFIGPGAWRGDDRSKAGYRAWFESVPLNLLVGIHVGDWVIAEPGGGFTACARAAFAVSYAPTAPTKEA